MTANVVAFAGEDFLTVVFGVHREARQVFVILVYYARGKAP